MENKKRIGFILSSIHSGSAINMWTTLMGEIQKTTHAFFIFPGGRLDAKTDYEYLRNNIYRFANKKNIDALISWGSSLGGEVSVKELEIFHNELKREFNVEPFVTIEHKVSKHSCVHFDAYVGMKDLVRHLINVHGATKIAFLRGPKNHVSATERYNGFCEVLAECGISIDEKLISSCFSWNGGEDAIKELCETRALIPGKDFDTLVASSDLLALPAVRYFEEHGYTIPEKVRVVGFNDSAESMVPAVPLTTVHMPFSELGVEAYNMLNVPECVDRIIPARLVIRQSCGCKNQERTAIENSIQAHDFDLLSQKAMQLFNDTQTQKKLSAEKEYNFAKIRAVLNSLKCGLLTCRNKKELVEQIGKYLPQIGIKQAVLATYTKDNKTQIVGGFSVHNKKTEFLPQVLPFDEPLLLPEQFSHYFSSGVFMVQPLFMEEQSLGYFMCNVPIMDGAVYEELRSAISSALKGVYLFEEFTEAMHRAEEAERKLLSRTKKLILFIGNNLIYPSWAYNTNNMSISGMRDFNAVIEETVPALIILDSLDYNSAAVIRQNPKTVLVPIIMLPRQVNDEEAVMRLCSMQRILLCNHAAAESDEFGARVNEILADGELLPAHTASTVKKAVLYFDTHAETQISRWKTANIVHVSEDYLTRIFHKEMGLSPWEYLNRCRIAKAADMLLHTNKTIYEITVETGFQDQAYFCRVFKKIQGVPPGQFRAPKQKKV